MKAFLEALGTQAETGVGDPCHSAEFWAATAAFPQPKKPRLAPLHFVALKLVP